MTQFDVRFFGTDVHIYIKYEVSMSKPVTRWTDCTQTMPTMTQDDNNSIYVK